MVDKETKRKGRNLNPEVYPFIQTLFADAIGETQSERAETAVLPAVVSLEMLAKTRSHLEIERKFLVTLVPENVDIFPSQLIRQGYLVVMPEAELRVRDEGGVKTLTRKEGTGLSRQETEVVLTNEQFEQLWLQTEGARIEKRRYLIPLGADLMSVDVYQGELQGLVVAEVEFSSQSEAEQFLPPTWCEVEVTHEPQYKNQSLALEGVPVSLMPSPHRKP